MSSIFFFFYATPATEIYTLPYTTLFRSLFVNVFSHIETNSHITGSFKRLTFSINRPQRSEERFSRNAETDLVCRLLLEKKKSSRAAPGAFPPHRGSRAHPTARASSAAAS